MSVNMTVEIEGIPVGATHVAMDMYGAIFAYFAPPSAMSDYEHLMSKADRSPVRCFIKNWKESIVDVHGNKVENEN